MRILFALSVLALLAGCAGARVDDPTLQDAAVLPVLCHTREDCTEKLARARTWIAAHTSRPIQAEGAALSTAKPTAADPRPGFTISLRDRTDGAYAFAFEADCYRGCNPSEEALQGDFNIYLSATNPRPLTPLPPPPGAK